MMMLGEQAQFVFRVSHKLDRFKQINRFAWNFRCPLCGDSQKRKSKARGYLYSWKDTIFFNCFNCNTALNLKQFLEQVDPELHKEFCLKKYQPKSGKIDQPLEVKAEMPEAVSCMAKLKRVSLLPETHSAYMYLKARKIPAKKFKSLYYCPDYGEWAELKGASGESRIIIPFFDPSGRLVLTQGRLLMGGKPGSPKYLTRRFSEDSLAFYGLNRNDPEETTYLVEGPIDAMFLRNSIAVAGSGLLPAAQRLLDLGWHKKDGIILVFDNEPHNREIVGEMIKSADSGFLVCVWPPGIKGKDINDLIKQGINVEEVIKTNSFRGLSLKVKISAWSKIKAKSNRFAGNDNKTGSAGRIYHE